MGVLQDARWPTILSPTGVRKNAPLSMGYGEKEAPLLRPGEGGLKGRMKVLPPHFALTSNSPKAVRP